MKPTPMTNARRQLSTRYMAGLRAHLRSKISHDGSRAQGLGRTAAADGLAAHDVAVIHDRAVVSLALEQHPAGLGNGAYERAGFFLSEALGPFEVIHRSTRESNRHLHQRNFALRRNAAALTRGKRRLEREITRRESAEKSILTGKEEYRTLFLESQLMQKKLRQLTRQVLSAQEEERKLISRELHDDVVQTLVGINVELSALGKGAEVSLRTLKAKIARTRRLVENSVKAVHRFARELRPAVLDDLGLIPALHAYSQNLAERKKIKIKMTAFGGVEALGGVKRTALFRVAQEALTNVARHAQATQVRMTISKMPGGILMEIGDNGKSFDVQQTLLARNPKRLGLVGMKERIEMIGGRFTIESKPGSGTTVRAEIPYPNNKAIL